MNILPTANLGFRAMSTDVVVTLVGGEPAILEPHKCDRLEWHAPGALPERTVEYVRAALAADPVKMDWRSGEQWNALDPAAVHTPTLVIHGERDPYAPVMNQAELFTQLGHPDRAWVILPWSDHAAHLEDAGPQFVHAVVEHLRRPSHAGAP